MEKTNSVEAAGLVLRGEKPEPVTLMDTFQEWWMLEGRGSFLVCSESLERQRSVGDLGNLIKYIISRV